jgi:uncharacterized protein YbjT (DUF2867 family)
MKKVLVIGSTGMIGKPVTRMLLQSPHDITLMARNQRKSQTLFPDAKIVYGDVFDPFSLLPVFEGKEIVYISLGPARNARKGDRMTEEEGIENIVAVAQQTGVKRLVLVSSLVQNYNNTNGYHWWIFDIKQKAVEMIKASGIAYTIFYPSTFMEGFDQLMMRGSNILLAGQSKAAMYFIAAKDFGSQVAKSFSLPDSINKEYVVQGPEAYTMDDGARVFMENYSKRKLKIMRAPLGLMRFFGKFSPTIDYGVKIVEALNNYPEQFEAQQTWNDLGKPETTIKDYAKQLA